MNTLSALNESFHECDFHKNLQNLYSNTLESSTYITFGATKCEMFWLKSRYLSRSGLLPHKFATPNNRELSVDLYQCSNNLEERDGITHQLCSCGFHVTLRQIFFINKVKEFFQQQWNKLHVFEINCLSYKYKLNPGFHKFSRESIENKLF